MDKVKIGIPRGIYYYYYGNFWKYFFKKCNMELVYSPSTTKEIVEMGSHLAPDEMCLSMKIYLGHIAYLQDKCDYILIPRIDRFDKENQTCTNFLALYDISKHYFKTPILNYNIDSQHDFLDGILNMKELKLSRVQCILAYEYAMKKEKEMKSRRENLQQQILNSSGKKVLIVSHAYNIHDDFIGSSIVKILKENHIQILYSDYFDEKKTNLLSKELSQDLYWKYSRDSIGSIPLCKEVDGIIFLSTFPCGLDSLVHELVIRKMEKPYLNLVIDDMSASTGLETRLESFVDLIEQN